MRLKELSAEQEVCEALEKIFIHAIHAEISFVMGDIRLAL